MRAKMYPRLIQTPAGLIQAPPGAGVAVPQHMGMAAAAGMIPTSMGFLPTAGGGLQAIPHQPQPGLPLGHMMNPLAATQLGLAAPSGVPGMPVPMLPGGLAAAARPPLVPGIPAAAAGGQLIPGLGIIPQSQGKFY